MIDLLDTELFTLGPEPGSGSERPRTLPGWVHALAQGEPLLPLRAVRSMHFPLLMHVADLALAALAHDARQEGRPLAPKALQQRLFDWSEENWAAGLRALAADRPAAMFTLAVADPAQPAYLQPPLLGLVKDKLEKDDAGRGRRKATTGNEPPLWALADKLTPDDLNPVGLRSVHGMHHGTWVGDPEIWALALMVRQTASPGLGSGFLGAVRGSRRAYASLHAELSPGAMFCFDVQRAIVDRANWEAKTTDRDRRLLLQRRPALLWDKPWAADSFYRPLEVDPFFIAPATPIRLVEGPDGQLRGVMVQCKDKDAKQIRPLRRTRDKAAWTVEIRDAWMAVRARKASEEAEGEKDNLEIRDHLGREFAQEIVAEFFAGTDSAPGDLPVTVRAGRREVEQYGKWWRLVLSGFCSDRDDPYREVVCEVEIGPWEADAEVYRPAKRWVDQLLANNRSFKAAFEKLRKWLRHVYADDSNLPLIKALVVAEQRRLDAVFFRELRLGLEAGDQGASWRDKLGKVAGAALDRFEQQNPIEDSKTMKRFIEARRKLAHELDKL